MSKVLYVDCFSGASGDMILGALIDAGLPIEELRTALGSLALGDVHVHAERVERSGIGAINFYVESESDGETKAHSHDGHSHEHSGVEGHHHHSNAVDQHNHNHRSLSEI